MCKIVLSGDINKDSFNCNLNAFFSFKSIDKLSKLALWPSKIKWSKIADFFFDKVMYRQIEGDAHEHSDIYLQLCMWDD